MICTAQLEQLILYLRNALGTSTFLTSKTKHIIDNSTILKLSTHLLYRKENGANWVNSLRTYGSREISECVLFVSAFRQRFNSPTVDKLGCWCLKKMVVLKASKQASKRTKGNHENSLPNTGWPQTSLRGDRRLPVLFQFQPF